MPRLVRCTSDPGVYEHGAVAEEWAHPHCIGARPCLWDALVKGVALQAAALKLVGAPLQWVPLPRFAAAAAAVRLLLGVRQKGEAARATPAREADHVVRQHGLQYRGDSRR